MTTKEELKEESKEEWRLARLRVKAYEEWLVRVWDPYRPQDTTHLRANLAEARSEEKRLRRCVRKERWKWWGFGAWVACCFFGGMTLGLIQRCANG